MNGAKSLTGHFLTTLLANAPYPAALAVTLFYCIQKQPIPFDASHGYALAISLLGVVLVVAAAVVGKRRDSMRFPWRRGNVGRGVAEKTVFTVLACACLFGAFNYYKFNPASFTGVNDYMDVTYYYTNSKYFDELGHYDLYSAILIADQEGPKRLRRIQRFRDLHTYQFTTRKAELTQDRIAEIKGQFTPERWEEFKADVNFLTQHYHNWDYLLSDRGYNPPPTWTVVGSILSRSTSIEKMKLITMVDFILIAATFVLIGWAYGTWVVLFAFLWFVSTFSGRWPILGQALLRFDWLAALVMSVCFLKLCRPVAAGALMAYSAASRVFPAIFFFPVVVAAAADSLRHRRIGSDCLRFFVAAAVVGAGLGGTALIRYGPAACRESLENLALHSRSFSSHRVGLGSVLVYRGETTMAEYNAVGGARAKEKMVQAWMPILLMIGVAALAFVAAYIIRTGHPVHELILLAAIPLFCVTNAQTNYYNLRLVLVMTHAADLRLWRNRIGLIALFLVETATQYTMLHATPRYTVTSVASIGMAAYFSIQMAFMAYEMLYPNVSPPEAIGSPDATRPVALSV